MHNAYSTGSNNGNVASQTYGVTAWVQHDYSYDELNRLTQDASSLWTDRVGDCHERWMPMKAVYSCLILFTVVSCERPPMTNIIVEKVESPDRKLSAFLVQRHIETSRDEFFLTVVSSDIDEGKAISARNLGESAALVAIRADKVQLRWQSHDELLAICDSCGIETIDIAKKVDRLGSIKITYQGFPAGIANE